MVPSRETAFYQTVMSQRSALPSSCSLEDNVKSGLSHWSLMGEDRGMDPSHVFFMPLSRPESPGQEEKTPLSPGEVTKAADTHLKDTPQPTCARHA